MLVSRRILVVDDDANGRLLLECVIQRVLPGAEVLTARDGTEALSVLERAAIDAVITDNRMCEMSGLEMVRRIRGSGSTIPIVMITGSEIEAEATEAGVTVFLREVKPQELGQKLQQCWSAIS